MMSLLKYVTSLIAFVMLGTSVAGSPVIDRYSDTWTATDALGRSLPGYEECGAVRTGKYVGIFYFLWHGQHGTLGPYDITKILQANPENPEWGGVHRFHYWGEPELGYYLAGDDYVIRCHCRMFVNAGVDVLVFDATNGFDYRPVYMKLCRIYSEMRKAGEQTPQMCFFVKNTSLVEKLYKEFYSKHLYQDLWFMFDGKPLICVNGPLDGLSKDVSNFFTLRSQCALRSPNKQDEWCWMQPYPQGYSWHTPGVPEEISVSIAQQETYMSKPTAHGRSYCAGSEPAPDKRDDSGRNFAEQWGRALTVDPQFIFITGWNEWVAQRFVDENGGTRFVDQYSKEFSRDVEPMKGGYGDDYYYQMVGYIRRFKGVRKPAGSSGPSAITIDGKFDDWNDVTPEYLDASGDAVQRDSKGWGDAGWYINHTGRNDFVRLKVAYDKQFIYFYAQTKDAITDFKGSNWMMLFIDSDCNSATGWNGYDYLVNGDVILSNLTTLQRNVGGMWNWEHQRNIFYRVSGNEMELAIPRAAIGQDIPHFAFNYHWVDNFKKSGDISEFSTNGDSAPDRRFNYHFEAESGTISNRK